MTYDRLALTFDSSLASSVDSLAGSESGESWPAAEEIETSSFGGSARGKTSMVGGSASVVSVVLGYGHYQQNNQDRLNR